MIVILADTDSLQIDSKKIFCYSLKYSNQPLVQLLVNLAISIETVALNFTDTGTFLFLTRLNHFKVILFILRYFHCTYA